MLNLFKIVCDPLLTYFSLTVADPCHELSDRVSEKAKDVRRQRKGTERGSSIFKTIRQQRAMMSPDSEFAGRLPSDVSVTQHYRHRGENSPH